MRSLMCALVSVSTLGCSEDLVDPEADGLSGSWTMVVDVTVATGACVGEELAPLDTLVVTLLQQGNSVTISGAFGDAGPQNLNGNLTAGVVTVGGSYPEDGGTTTATHTLTVASDERSMDGTEAWSWTGPGGSCPGSASIVTAVKN